MPPGDGPGSGTGDTGAPCPGAPCPGGALARGVCRMLAERGFASLTEFAIRDGLRMDVLALGPKGELWCVEVKSSRADFLADTKWPGYLPWCDRFFFAVPESFPDDLLPPEHGLVRADRWGAEIVRFGTEDPVPAARRRTLTLAFARLAAGRLLRLTDPLPRGPVTA